MSDQPATDLHIPSLTLLPTSPTTSAGSVDTQAELSSIVLADQPLGAVLRRVAELAVRTVPGADDASVTLIERGRAKTVAFFGPLAVSLDERQYEAGFGPCMEAARTGRTIQVDTASDSGPFAGFARQARRAGVSHVLALGLPVFHQTRGALNLYANSGPFTRTAREAAESFVKYSAVTLFNATVYAGALGEVAQMKEAMASRAVIEQAKGIIMLEKHCSADEAFALLSKVSSVSNRKIRDIARDIVQRASST